MNQPRDDDSSETVDAETARLVAAAGAGDGNAVAELFNQHRARLRTMVRLRIDRRLAGRIDPSDVLQDTFLEVARRMPDYAERGEMPLHLWLRFLAMQQLLQLHRRHLGTGMRDAGREVSLHGGGSPRVESASIAAQLVGQFSSPSQAAVRAERQQQMETALNAMDPIDREVLVLRHFEQLSNSDVARLLDISKTAASNRYVRALQRLRQMLDFKTGDA